MAMKLTGIILLAWSVSVNAEKLTFDNLDNYLKSSESKYSDIVDGAQKQVVWNNNIPVKTKLSIVYLHGFSASAKELDPLIENLSNKLGANTYYTRLRGHGRSDDAMAEATLDDWKTDVLESYRIGKLIGDNVIFIGTSTGATLSTWLIAQNSFNDEDVIANILISPNFAVKSSGTWILKSSMGLWIAKQISGEYRSFTPHNEFHGKYWTERYPIDALQPMVLLLDEVDNLDKSSVKTPHLMVYSPEDKVVDIDKAIETVTQMTNATVEQIPFTTSTDPYQHVLVGKASTLKDDVNVQVDKMQSIIETFINGLTP